MGKLSAHINSHHFQKGMETEWAGPNGAHRLPRQTILHSLLIPCTLSLWTVSYLTQENRLWLFSFFFFFHWPHQKKLRLHIWPVWVDKLTHWRGKIHPSSFFKIGDVSKNRSLKIMCLSVRCRRGWLCLGYVSDAFSGSSGEQCPWSTGTSCQTWETSW